MPIIKSAKKRVRQTTSAKARNDKTRSELRNALKKFQASLKSKKNIAESLREAQSTIDKAAKKNVLSANKASRKKSQLSAAAKSAGSKPASKVKAAPVKKAPVAKKPVAKKSVTKK